MIDCQFPIQHLIRCWQEKRTDETENNPDKEINNFRCIQRTCKKKEHVSTISTGNRAHFVNNEFFNKRLVSAEGLILFTSEDYGC